MSYDTAILKVREIKEKISAQLRAMSHAQIQEFFNASSTHIHDKVKEPESKYETKYPPDISRI